jgi:hypothetical protein
MVGRRRHGTLPVASTLRVGAVAPPFCSSTGRFRVQSLQILLFLAAACTACVVAGFGLFAWHDRRLARLSRLHRS